MHLHEEYISRHKLNVPLVRYDSFSTAFLRSKETPIFWRIVNIRWRSCHWHPGNFEIACKKPCHDVANRFRNVLGPKEIYWDEYEAYVVKMVKGLKDDFHAIPKSECSLASWHMFLLMYDTHIARLDRKVLDWVAVSIDPEASVPKKYMAFAEALRDIQQENPTLYDCYQSYLHPLTEHYAEWLVKLIND